MLKTRVITALCLLAGLVGVLFYLPDQLVALVFAAVAGLAAWEWGGLMLAAPSARIAYGVFFAVLMAILTLAGLMPLVLPLLCVAAMIFWLLLVPFWFRFRWPLPRGLAGYAVGVLVLLPAWLALLELHRQDVWRLLAAMAVVWVADIAAYFVGRAIGRNKLAPTISPGKTREGAAGAFVAVLVYGLALYFTRAPEANAVALPGLVIVLLLLTALSIMGDLFESMLKRQAGIKDSSNLLPGHGGVLDRIDSLTSTLPLVALYFYWVGL